MATLLTDGTISVRPHEPTDADALYSAVKESIKEIGPWLPWCHPGYSMADAHGFIEFSRKGWADSSQFHFVICLVGTTAIVGGISLNHIAKANRLANMGYWVRTGAARRGVATAAARLVARYGFGNLGLTRIEIAAMPENVRSRRVAERLGAKFESLARNRLVMHERAHDAALYSLVPADLVD
jgi:RimJ/RimL family protein N-acetyltransferase